MQTCSSHGISELFFNDPPGFWSVERLREWCRHLRQHQNTQPWAFQSMPRKLPEEIIIALADTGCRRIELIVTSTCPEIRAEMGCHLDDNEMRALGNELQIRNVKPQFIYWIQGPLEPDGEADRIFRHLTFLNFPEFAVQSFPLHPDSILYNKIVGKGMQPPKLSEWSNWIQHPKLIVPPPALWQGNAGEKPCQRTMKLLYKKITGNPRVRLKRIFRHTSHRTILKSMENRIISLFSGG